MDDKKENKNMAEDPKYKLFLSQKETLDIFLEHHTITKEQYEKSLGTLKEKMGFDKDGG